MVNKCLIVANDPWLIQLLTMFSEECGLVVTQAFDGQDVSSRAAIEKPNAILIQMDLLGAVRSHELLKRLRNEPQTTDIPVILFSWQADDQWGGDEGAIILNEPVTYAGFVNALHAAGVSVSPDLSGHFKSEPPGNRRRKARN